MEDGFLISARNVKELAELRRRYLPRQLSIPRDRGRRPSPDIEWEGKLLADLNKPTNGWTSPTTVTVQLYEPDLTSTADPIAFITSIAFPDPITVINRDPSCTGVTGAYCRVKQINGEWKFTWIGCPP